MLFPLPWPQKRERKEGEKGERKGMEHKLDSSY